MIARCNEYFLADLQEQTDNIYYINEFENNIAALGMS